MDVREGFNLIGRGQTLRIPYGESVMPQAIGECEFMASPPYAAVPCSRRIAKKIISHACIFHMTELRTGDRLGWRDLGWPEGSDYYCMVQ